MEGLTFILISILAFCLVFYVLATYFRPYAKLKAIKNASRVLLVVAHPDDETMFFGPTILNFCRNNGGQNFFLLCMSNGDFYNRGRVRKFELYKACQVLGIPEENITVLNYTRLRDDPSIRWKEELVSEVVLQTIHAHEVDTVLTFDRHGVSGHKNHSSLYNAMAHMNMEHKLPPKTRVFALRSVNLLRKYSSILDLPMSFLLAPNVYTASLRDWFRLHSAMAAHYSQYAWFRKLYMIFSRYNFINTYDQVNIFPVQGSSGANFKGDAIRKKVL